MTDDDDKSSYATVLSLSPPDKPTFIIERQVVTPPLITQRDRLQELSQARRRASEAREKQRQALEELLEKVVCDFP